LFGGVHIGPQLLLGFGLALGWGLVLGLGFGQWLLARGVPSVRLPVLRLRAPSWQRVSALSLLVIVALTITDIASGGPPAAARTSPLTRTGSLSVPAQPEPFPTLSLPPYTPPPITPIPPDLGSTPISGADAQAQGLLVQAGTLEQSYHSQHGTYTSSLAALGLAVPRTIKLRVAAASADGYCMTATVMATGREFSYSSAALFIEDGNTC